LNHRDDERIGGWALLPWDCPHFGITDFWFSMGNAIDHSSLAVGDLQLIKPGVAIHQMQISYYPVRVY
jgi:hypothetical protein